LRAYALGGRAAGTLPQGLALILRHGMPAWLEAWRRSTPSRLEAFPAPVAAARERPVGGLHAEVALVLAGMALRTMGG
jgi:hypothetical protein